MASVNFETVNGVLIINGSLDNATEQDLLRNLENYVKATPVGSRVVDLSNVRWLAPSSAKALIQAGQDANEKNDKIRVLASRQVLQTLNLLGARTWLNIESSAPTRPPGENDAVSPAPPPLPNPTTPVTEPAPTAQSVAPATAVAVKEPLVVADSTVLIRSRAANGGAIAGPEEELTRGAVLLRELYLGRRYGFTFGGGQQVIGNLAGRIGGPWIMIESHGSKKMVNLDQVQYCETM